MQLQKITKDMHADRQTDSHTQPKHIKTNKMTRAPSEDSDQFKGR